MRIGGDARATPKTAAVGRNCNLGSGGRRRRATSWDGGVGKRWLNCRERTGNRRRRSKWRRRFRRDGALPDFAEPVSQRSGSAGRARARFAGFGDRFRASNPGVASRPCAGVRLNRTLSECASRLGPAASSSEPSPRARDIAERGRDVVSVPVCENRFETGKFGFRTGEAIGGSRYPECQRPQTHALWPVTALRTIASAVRKSSMPICPGAELLLPTANVAAEP